MGDKKLKLFFENEQLVEGNSLAQVQTTLKLPGVEQAVAFPDLHAGRGIPIGAAFMVRGMIYPHMIGNDIGCGMSFFEIDLLKHKFKVSKIEKKLTGLELPLDIAEIPDGLKFQNSLGTIGGGNHFAEFQSVDEVFDEILFNQLNISDKNIFILVHSGSRGLGESILSKTLADHGAKGLSFETDACKQYLSEHDYAVNWATLNREMIAKRICKLIVSEHKSVLSNTHNEVSIAGDFAIHRKGASRVDEYAIIPGSRGDFSYLVKVNNNSIDNLFSLPHGSGRKWARGHVKDRLSHRYKVQDLQKTALGSIVICEDKELLYDEAPEAYKKSSFVIGELLKFNLITIVAKLRPLLTYKKREVVW